MGGGWRGVKSQVLGSRGGKRSDGGRGSMEHGWGIKEEGGGGGGGVKGQMLGCGCGSTKKEQSPHKSNWQWPWAWGCTYQSRHESNGQGKQAAPTGLERCKLRGPFCQPAPLQLSPCSIGQGLSF